MRGGAASVLHDFPEGVAADARVCFFDVEHAHYVPVSFCAPIDFLEEPTADLECVLSASSFAETVLGFV